MRYYGYTLVGIATRVVGTCSHAAHNAPQSSGLHLNEGAPGYGTVTVGCVLLLSTSAQELTVGCGW